ncbi:MAG: DUF3783 domain-containing protein [Clostridium sp.]
MSFEKIDIKDNKINEERSCIIVCNFAGKELQFIKNYGAVFGIKDQILLNSKNGDSIVKDIIENNYIVEGEVGSNAKAIIFNNVSPAKMNIFIENLKKVRVKNILMATVTETSREWSINTLLTNLVEERKAMNAGKTLNHK